MLAGTHTYNAGLDIVPNNGSATLILDGNTNNPTVNISSGLATNGASGHSQIIMGTNPWTLVSGDWDLRSQSTAPENGAINQPAGGILRFSGTRFAKCLFVE